MARKQILTCEQITQEIIMCDDWIFRLMGMPELQQVWIDKRNDFEFMLEDLKNDIEIELL